MRYGSRPQSLHQHLPERHFHTCRLLPLYHAPLSRARFQTTIVRQTKRKAIRVDLKGLAGRALQLPPPLAGADAPASANPGREHPRTIIKRTANRQITCTSRTTRGPKKDA